MKGSAQPLINILLKAGLLKARPDDALLSKSTRGPLCTLSMEGLLDEGEAIQFLCKHFKMEYVDLSSAEVSQKIQWEAYASSVTASFLWEHRIIPLYEVGPSILVALADPTDHEAVRALSFALSKPVTPALAVEELIIQELSRNAPNMLADPNRISDKKDDDIEIVDSNSSDDIADVDDVNTETPPIIKLTNKILGDAVHLGASDIHLDPTPQHMVVRFRVDGILQDIIHIPGSLQVHVVGRYKILAKMNIAEKRRPQDGKLRFKVNKTPCDVRVSSIPTAYGEKLVLRILGTSFAAQGFAGVGMPPAIEAKVLDALEKRGRLFLVSGPTGSGKTSTLYVALQHLIDGTTNISTIEDPIEYRLKGVNQTQINDKAKITFASVLRSLLRQDPDVIMVGEIRDPETLQTVLQAAQTGHLVLSTVHTNDAPSAILRMRNMGADPMVLASSLIGIMAQRLVRKLCTKCKAPVTPEQLVSHQKYLDRYKLKPEVMYTNNGCDDCSFSGYKGRTGLFSYLQVSENVAQAISDGVSQEELITKARMDGFVSLEEAAIGRVCAGETSFDEIRPYLSSEEPHALPVSKPLPMLESPTTAAPSSTSTTIQSGPQEITIRLEGNNIPQAQAPKNLGPQRPRILVIDDNKSVRKMLMTLLQKDLAEVTEAEHGLQGLERVFDAPPNLIVCDVAMPTMDGREFLRKMKSNKQTRDIPIVMLTIDDDQENEMELLALGARALVSKKTPAPLMISRLRTFIDAL